MIKKSCCLLTRVDPGVINRSMTSLNIKTSLLKKTGKKSSQIMEQSASSTFERVSIPRVVGSDSANTPGGLRSIINMLSQFVTVGGDFV